MTGKLKAAFVLLSVALFAGGLTAMLLCGNPAAAGINADKADDKNNLTEAEAGDTKNALTDTSANETANSDADALPKDKSPLDESAVKTTDGKNAVEEGLALLREQYESIVVLDPGHGGSDSGITVKGTGKNKGKILTEKELTLDMAKRVKAIVEKQGVYVILSREEDTDTDDESRVAMANFLPADLFVSFHLSEDEDSSVHGVSAFVTASHAQSEQTAALLLEKVSEAANEKSLGVFTDDGGSKVLSGCRITAVEFDLGYLSNRQDVKLLFRDDHRQKIAEGISQGIMECLDETEDPDRTE